MPSHSIGSDRLAATQDSPHVFGRARKLHTLPPSFPSTPTPPPPKKKINRMHFYARNFMGFVASISWPISS